jgi:hypothetical protein
MKQCRDCKGIKPFSQMQRHPGFKDGYNTLCSDCNYKRVQAWRIANREKHRAQTKKYADQNLFQTNARMAKRRASRRNQMPYWADSDRIKEIYKAAKKLTLDTGIPHEVDHIIPLQGELVSGLHVHYNLQILPRDQNRSKGNKLQGY